MAAAGSILNDRYNRFAEAEAIFATRINLIRSVRRAEQRVQFTDVPSELCRKAAETEFLCQFHLSRRARIAGDLQTSLNSIYAAEALEGLVSQTVATSSKLDLAEELCNILWAKEEHKLAIQTLHAQINHLKTSHGQASPRLAHLLARLVRMTEKYSASIEKVITGVLVIKVASTERG